MELYANSLMVAQCNFGRAVWFTTCQYVWLTFYVTETRYPAETRYLYFMKDSANC